ncbi:MAG: cell division protein ZapD, partial [Gammaproteobacteria bacterium]|nr:cell division protein ZapD [Gammaproteobacteria bacterium]
MHNRVYYEQPLNERIRTFLRLEMLFQQAWHHLHGDSLWDSRAALNALDDICNVFGRSDLKTEVLKELERQTATLARMERSPGVDRERLGEILDELEVLTDRLYGLSGQPGATLKNHELLGSIRQRSTIPGGTCAFDLPAFHLWLQRPAEERTAELKSWLAVFSPIQQAVELVLRLTRHSATPTQEEATDGFFQRNLDPNLPCQMIRVGVDGDADCYAEISGGRHRFTVRFMAQRKLSERAA